MNSSVVWHSLFKIAFMNQQHKTHSICDAFSSILNLIKFQFYSRHWIVYFIFPLIFSWYVILMRWEYSLVNSSSFGVLVSIIWVIWGLLLNFLILIITNNESVLTRCRNDFDERNIYWLVKLGGKSPVIRPINNYLFVYYKIFFLIYLSILFLLGYVLYLAFAHCMIDWHVFLKYTVYVTYISFVVFYFLNFFHLIYFLYYFLHSDSATSSA